jgi:chaperonin GroES
MDEYGGAVSPPWSIELDRRRLRVRRGVRLAYDHGWRHDQPVRHHGEERPMNFRPLHDRVVIRRLTAEERTTGGIIIPDTAQEKPMQGEVIAVGPGARNEQGQLVPLDVRTGHRILFGKWSGTEVKLDGEELLIMKESDIMGIIEGQPASASHANRMESAGVR